MCNPQALISGGASIIGGIAGRSAAKKKSKAEAKATQENYARQQAAISQFNASDPYATLGGAGSENSSQIAALLGQNGQDPTEMLRSTPGYQFSFNEGMKAIEHSLGAKNALYSSKAMRDITRYGQGMADQLARAQLALGRTLRAGCVAAVLFAAHRAPPWFAAGDRTRLKKRRAGV